MHVLTPHACTRPYPPHHPPVHLPFPTPHLCILAPALPSSPPMDVCEPSSPLLPTGPFHTPSGRNVYMQFSSHKELSVQAGSALALQASSVRQGSGLTSHAGQGNPNKILLITIHHAIYSITTDVLHQVFSPYGPVDKVVIFSKSAGMQALVEFRATANAQAAMAALQGRNIYDGCCQMEMQFSNLETLNVTQNNDRTKDYTNLTLPSDSRTPGRIGAMASNTGVMSLFTEGGLYGGLGHSAGGQAAGFHQPMGLPHHPGMPVMPGLATPGALVQNPMFAGAQDQRCVLIVSGLNAELVTLDALFNVFSNYGNVLRAKLLNNKPDHALVQMSDQAQAQMAITHLKGRVLFGKPMDVNFSKHPQINATMDCKDYSTSKLNRFMRAGVQNFRHITSPTNVIHCSSLPADVTADSLKAHLSVPERNEVLNVKLFEVNGKKQALAEVANEEQALNTMALKHASDFNGSTIRLAFSKSSMQSK
eukprot:jgi/Mesvir1/26339/Mv22515-RA.3